jgi:hypothetical protein
MANSFFQLPTPVGNGAGPAVDVSTLGPSKTLLVGGDFDAVVNFEVSTDGGTNWGPVTSVQGPYFQTWPISATHMRVRISGLLNGTPVCFVGSEVTGSKSDILAVPAGNGSGAASDIGDFGDQLTVVVAGSFGGSISVEVSDNGTEWSPLMFFNNPGIQTVSCFANFIRVFRSGVGFDPGLPVIAVAASDTVGSAGITALSEPVAYIMFRPFDTAGRRDNVYVDWDECYAAVREAALRGIVQLAFDTQFCPVFLTPGGQNIRTFTIPAGTWDMRSVWWCSNTPFNALTFADGCFIESVEAFQGRQLVLINNSLYSTPFIMGGVSPFGGTRPGSGLEAGRTDLINTVPGCKPVVKQAGGSFFSPLGSAIYHSFGSPQLMGSGNQTCPSPVWDMGGFNLTCANIIFENNCFTSLVGAVCTGPSTTLLSPVTPGDTVINVVSTAAFPASGTIQINNSRGWGEDFVYTSVTATSFIGAVGAKYGYPGPSGAATGSPVIAPVAVSPGATTINVNSTTGFAASGALRFNGLGEVVTYTGVTATSFTGVSPVVGTYRIGHLLEPIRAVGTGALPAGSVTIPVDSTAGFPAAGSLFLYQNGVSETVVYTGVTATSFTGVGPTVNSYGTGAVMERASSFRGGVLTNNISMPAASSGRFNTMEWQMPNLDLSTVTVPATPFGSLGTSTRLRHVIRTATPLTPVPTTTVGTHAVGGTVLNVASTAGYPTSGYIVINNGAESVRYTGITATSFTGCQPFIKAHAAGVAVNYGVTFGEVMLLNATGAVTVQLPTASRSYGEIVTIKEASSGAAGITLLPFTGQTIDGAASLAVAGALARRQLVSNGVGGWLVIAS